MPADRDDLLRALEAEGRRSTTDGVHFMQAIAERSGMSLTDLQCLNILAGTGPITAGQLAQEMRLTTGAITGLVNRLERAGYVRRDKDPADGRRAVISLVTEAMERDGANLLGPRDQIMETLFDGYDERELAVILDFLRRTNAMREAETARIRAEISAKMSEQPTH
ncbi:MarR family winged helix-turn-helix transcriptional regulator [Nonomuraea turcica]|uniref:MarR family winged helix-turn-helix transcriptional regulator n=1 Tax=Nonomuraea sp. G32 TaxID=3067274 RepID=UPI00273CEE35|nr:MarR family transcriptional regulator [Nonomuraea sp. G32]MDP4510717.1 MarR family transcriptional regulator [Nonomuraea sp. G32]